jgi:hypothetical protein
MGQTWSKPVLANIRYNNKITRVMIVGGGYDACYENPQFRLGNANQLNMVVAVIRLKRKVMQSTLLMLKLVSVYGGLAPLVPI